MVARWIYHYLFIQCLSPLTLWVRIPFMARCTRNNCMWLVRVGGFLGVLHLPPPINWPPRYNWNIVESAVKYPNPNHNPCSFNINCKLCATDEKSRFWFKVDHCFTILSSDGFVHYLTFKWWLRTSVLLELPRRINSSLRMFFGCHRDLVQPCIIVLSTNDHGYVSFVVITLVVSSSLGL
jgi:hypothetical protein